MNQAAPAEAMRDFIAHGAQVLYLVADRRGLVVEHNDYASELLGDTNGKNLLDIFVDFHSRISLADLHSTLPKGLLASLSTAQGMPESFYMSFYPTESNGLVILGSPDNTGMRALRNELLQANARMLNLSRELHQKNAILSDLDRQKNELLAVAAHDLRTPAGNIFGMAELLTEGRIPADTAREFLVRIQSMSSHMLDVLAHVLDYSTIEAGHIALDLKPVSLPELLSRSVRMMGMLAEAKGLVIETSIPEALPSVEIDAFRIEQVLNNLLSNAVKFSFPGSQIGLECRRLEGSVAISVEDRGPGIPAAELGLLFKPFSKTSVRSTAGETNTGLGLAIAKSIVEAHRGRIVVESEVNRGTTVTVSLPIQQAQP